jgi:uncharacterized protein (DUF433 family)
VHESDSTRLRALGRYTADEVARLAGVSPRRIGTWARYGVVPSISEGHRIYSYADVAEAILVHYLIDQGLRPKDVRHIVQHLRAEFGPWPLTNAPLEHDGKLVVRKHGPDLYFDVVEHLEHRVIGGTLLDLRAVRDALEQGGWVAIDQPRHHIQVDPELHSGEPVIRGRRVPTATVARLAASRDGRDVLREDYELSDEQIDEAVGYEADVAAIAA